MTSSLGTGNYGGRRYLPYVFTEQGIAMLAPLLKNKIAVQVSINIMNAFVIMRHFLKENGPATSWELYSYIQHSEDHSVDDALRELEYRGYLRSKYSRSKYRYWFADDAIAGSYEDAMASAPSIEDKVVRALVRRGPSSVGSLSFDSEANETRVRKIVNSLVERGRAVVDKTSKPYIYSLVEGWQDTQPPDAA